MRWLYVIGFALLFWIGGSVIAGLAIALAAPGLPPAFNAAVYFGCLVGGGVYGEHRFLRSRHGAEVAERRRAAQQSPGNLSG